MKVISKIAYNYFRKKTHMFQFSIAEYFSPKYKLKGTDNPMQSNQ